METKPTHEQAQLHLQVFELRREARLRQARDWYFKNGHFNSMEDFNRIAAPGAEGGTFTFMVYGYWGQACALLNYGLLHDDLFFETSGEFFWVWESVRAIVPQIRKDWVDTQFLSQVEKAAQRYEAWMERRSPGHIAAMREWMKTMQPKKKASKTKSKRK
jgi:hypothetical protein